MFLYGVLAVGGFLLFRLMTAFFDFRTAYSILSSNLLIYLEREVGQFYTSDTGAALLRLKSDLVEAITRQTAGLQESVGKLSNNLVEAIDKKLTGINDTVKKSMEEWDKVLSNAGNVQGSINEAAERMRVAVSDLTSVSESLTGGLSDNNKSVSEQLAALTEATASFADEQKAFLTQAGLIERNQHILEKTYQSYELSLQNLTQQLGDGLGAYLNMHAQTASKAVSDTMAANIDKIAQLIKLGSNQHA
jgi:chromosome segregation ATPase